MWSEEPPRFVGSSAAGAHATTRSAWGSSIDRLDRDVEAKRRECGLDLLAVACADRAQLDSRDPARDARSELAPDRTRPGERAAGHAAGLRYRPGAAP